MDGNQTLHEARMKRNLGLGELKAKTSLSAAVLQKIDEGRFDELPAGVYARAYVKSFAAEVGLDPDEALRELEHLLPGAPDPLPVLRELREPDLGDRFAAIVARVTKREIAGTAKSNATAAVEPSGASDSYQVRVPADDSSEEHTSASFRLNVTRVGAAAIDATILIAMNGALVLAVALGTGVSPAALMRHGSGGVGILCAVPTTLYFILFNGVGSGTLGRWLCRLSETSLQRPLTVDAILRRSIAPGSRLAPDVNLRTTLEVRS
jgi:hypothetical protein